MDQFSKTLPKWEGPDLLPRSQWPKIYNYSHIETESLLLMQDVVFRTTLRSHRLQASKMAKATPCVFINSSDQLKYKREKFPFPGDFQHSSFRVYCIPLFLVPPATALEALVTGSLEPSREKTIRSRLYAAFLGLNYGWGRIPRSVEKVPLTIRLQTPKIPANLLEEIWLKSNELALESSVYDYGRKVNRTKFELDDFEENKKKAEEKLNRVKKILSTKTSLLLGSIHEKST